MSSAVAGRFSSLLRWLGITLVVLLALQLLAVLSVNGWGDESFRQLLSSTLITQSPMALVGMLLMLLGARLEDPLSGPNPLRWTVCVISGVLALALLFTVPATISGDQSLSDQTNQSLQAQRGQLELAKAQLDNPKVLEQVIDQGVQNGQIPEAASDEEKKKAARAFMESQLQQAENQIKQAETRRDLALNQRRIGGTGTAVVLVIAFALLALAAVL
ncbi:HpsJ family protein [Synechococcus sp. A10-1-5-1]|uniref:HpsJ family protein n=1 Tax=Synechococcus sp. A10-1-5-1 TaxID=2936507 RepID=UPI0020014C8A|nr:HpsJ family protein [Synechococcus sp. A10-1-5-1]UPM49270.1 HpsJ family protein [Synechococcus sp. A10-1-5-1]